MLLLSHKKDLTITKNLFKGNVISKNELNQQERVVHKSALELTTDLNAQKAMLRHINELYDKANVEFSNYLKDISRDLDHNQRTLIDEISNATILEKKYPNIQFYLRLWEQLFTTKVFLLVTIYKNHSS